MAFNENTRVKIPAILHLCKLGYKYISLSNAERDESTNIFSDIFAESILRINPDKDENDVKKLFEDASLALDNEDLGQAFYEMLIATSGTKLIDFKDFDNNSFHVVTELTYKNGDDEFRPDITLLINGMPLAFIEVKKPNNQEGVLAERDRINTRFKNKKFWKCAELYINHPNNKSKNKQIFNALFSHKDEINAAFDAPLVWNPLDNKVPCRIGYEMEIGDYENDEANWQTIQTSMIDAMMRLEKTLSSFIAKLP